jgi:hypothetical protein
LVWGVALDVTLANPVGLYFDGLLTGGWETTDGSDPKSYWCCLRGTEEKPVRAVYEVPADRGFVVGDITINGRRIDFGAQIADFITTRLWPFPPYPDSRKMAARGGLNCRGMRG